MEPSGARPHEHPEGPPAEVRVPEGWPPTPARRPSLWQVLLTELGHHLPYTVAAVAVGLAVVWSLVRAVTPAAMDDLFHILHPVHLLFSATATTAMVKVQGGRSVPAAVIGFLGSVIPCSLSDVVLPWLGGAALGADMHLHLCVIEHPFVLIPYLAVGLVLGLMAPRIVSRSTIWSHAAHVLVSAFASLLYLVSFGLVLSVASLGWIVGLLIAAVIVPCCASDIVIPIALGRPSCPHDGHAH